MTIDNYKFAGKKAIVRVDFNVPLDENGKITAFEEKPEKPRSNLASMGIYIFSWEVLKEALIAQAEVPGCDFGKHIIPYCFAKYGNLYTYEFHGYWKDVGTLSSYWEANMELIDVVPEFNLYEEYWKIYTKSEILPPQYVAKGGVIERSIVGEGSEIYGQVYNSVIGCGVTIGKDTVVRDSIIMNNTEIGASCELSKAIVAENTKIGSRQTGRRGGSTERYCTAYLLRRYCHCW